MRQVFALTWPQFQEIGETLDRLAWNRALNEVFFGVVSAFGEEKDRGNLFSSAGTYLRTNQRMGGGQWREGVDYTPEMVELAQKHARQIMENLKGETSG